MGSRRQLPRKTMIIDCFGTMLLLAMILTTPLTQVAADTSRKAEPLLEIPLSPHSTEAFSRALTVEAASPGGTTSLHMTVRIKLHRHYVETNDPLRIYLLGPHGKWIVTQSAKPLAGLDAALIYSDTKERIDESLGSMQTTRFMLVNSTCSSRTAMMCGYHLYFIRSWTSSEATKLVSAIKKKATGNKAPDISLACFERPGLIPDFKHFAASIDKEDNQNFWRIGTLGGTQVVVKKRLSSTYSNCVAECKKDNSQGIVAWIANKEEHDTMVQRQKVLGVRESWFSGISVQGKSNMATLCWETHPKFISIASCINGDESLFWRRGVCKGSYYCGAIQTSNLDESPTGSSTNPLGMRSDLGGSMQQQMWRDRARHIKFQGCTCKEPSTLFKNHAGKVSVEKISYVARSYTSTPSMTSSSSLTPTTSLVATPSREPTRTSSASLLPLISPTNVPTTSLTRSVSYGTPSQPLTTTKTTTLTMSEPVEWRVPTIHVTKPPDGIIYSDLLGPKEAKDEKGSISSTSQSDANGKGDTSTPEQLDSPEEMEAREVEMIITEGAWDCDVVKADLRYLLTCDGALSSPEQMGKTLPTYAVSCTDGTVTLHLQRTDSYVKAGDATQVENCTLFVDDLVYYVKPEGDLLPHGVTLTHRFVIMERPEPPPPIAPKVSEEVATSAKATSQASAVVASAAGNPAMAVQAARTAMILALAECRDNSAEEGLDAMSHPLQFSVGSGVAAPFAGACIGNPVLVVLCCGIHFFIVWARAEYDGDMGRRIIFQKYAAAMHFPALQIVLILPLLQPTVVSVTTVFRLGTDASQYACGVIGGLFIGLLTWFVWWLTRKKIFCTFYTFEELGQDAHWFYIFVMGNGEYRDYGDVPHEAVKRRKDRIEKEEAEAAEIKRLVDKTAKITRDANLEATRLKANGMRIPAELEERVFAASAAGLKQQEEAKKKVEALESSGSGNTDNDGQPRPVTGVGTAEHLDNWLLQAAEVRSLDSLDNDDPVRPRPKKEGQADTERDKQMQAQFVDKYFLFFDTYREGLAWFCAAEIVLSILFGTIEGWRPQSVIGCQTCIALMLSLFGVFVMFIYCLRPFVAMYDLSFAFGISAVQVTGSIATLVYAIQHDNETAMAVGEFSAVAGMYMLGLKAFADVLILVYDLCFRKVQLKIEAMIKENSNASPTKPKALPEDDVKKSHLTIKALYGADGPLSPAHQHIHLDGGGATSSQQQQQQQAKGLHQDNNDWDQPLLLVVPHNDEVQANTAHWSAPLDNGSKPRDEAQAQNPLLSGSGAHQYIDDDHLLDVGLDADASMAFQKSHEWLVDVERHRDSSSAVPPLPNNGLTQQPRGRGGITRKVKSSNVPEQAAPPRSAVAMWMDSVDHSPDKPIVPAHRMRDQWGK